MRKKKKLGRLVYYDFLERKPVKKDKEKYIPIAKKIAKRLVTKKI